VIASPKKDESLNNNEGDQDGIENKRVVVWPVDVRVALVDMEMIFTSFRLDALGKFV
jgi:hypothetical protein